MELFLSAMLICNFLAAVSLVSISLIFSYLNTNLLLVQSGHYVSFYNCY
jgi:hypothetical protein